MLFDTNNPIVKRCTEGMEMEHLFRTEEAAALFLEAWEMAVTDEEKCIAAHYVARHAGSVEKKLEWDLRALSYGEQAEEHRANLLLPSLLLNVAKGYEDVLDFKAALESYNRAKEVATQLPDDGYGQMTRAGIAAGLERMTNA